MNKSKLKIRQTKASLFRLAKNNPLMLSEELDLETNVPAKKSDMLRKLNKVSPIDLESNVICKIEHDASKVNLVKSETTRSLSNLHKKENVPSKMGACKKNESKCSGKPSLHVSRKEEVTKKSVVDNVNNKQRQVIHNKQVNNSKQVINNKQINNSKQVINNKQQITNNKQVANNTLNKFKVKPRRSLSAQHFEKKKHGAILEPEKLAIRAEMTQSLENIAEISDIHPPKKHVKFLSPAVCFKRRQTERNSFMHSTPKAQLDDLRSRLNDWLKKRGKSMGTYHHLKCFGVHGNNKKVTEDNKENVEVNVNLARTESYEALHIIPAVEEVKEKQPEVIQPYSKSLVIDALYDLHKLILEGYTIDQCEAWVAAIRQKYAKIEEEPQYWECRAAIERSRGNITSAVHCLTTAITKGAAINHVEESLEQLFEKFGKLEINTSTVDKTEDAQMKLLNQKCNIFKSTLIQFAVREQKRVKQKGPQSPTTPKVYVATPIRRSSRLSRSGYLSTPGMIVCDSLKDLDSSLKENFSFKSNQYLE